MITTRVHLAAGVAASALAMALPVTAHAATGTTGPCSTTMSGAGVQSTGKGAHTFTHSNDNCVHFTGVDDTTRLNQSDFNLMVMGGDDNTARLKRSDANTITFQPVTGFDRLTATNSVMDTITFLNGAFNDTASVSDLVGGTISIAGSNDFLVFDANCGTTARSVTASNLGTSAMPITVC